MFDFYFHGLEDEEGLFYYFGGTMDFLDLICQIAEKYSSDVAGNFVKALTLEKKKNIESLRVENWGFEYTWGTKGEKIRIDYKTTTV